ncbi:MAG: LPP20 family lipoprotein, partial [Sulfurimonas sp.]|nr:LPP20 family lipoprotein [Sulfurimonas sp.]
QAYALAKRAATADAYRLLAEKVKGVRIDGQDLIKNMMVQRSTVRTTVQAMVKNANVVETTFKEGLCEVEMEIVLAHAQFSN